MWWALHRCHEAHGLDLLGETKAEDMFYPVIGLQPTGPDSPSSEVNDLEMCLLWTSGTQYQQFHFADLFQWVIANVAAAYVKQFC